MLAAEHVFTKKTGDYRFLTLRGAKPKEQKINYANSICKTISKTYLIVREKNHQNDGYHFHAILDCHKEPSKRFFKKGVHMHLKKIGRPDTLEGFVLPLPDPFPTPKDRYDYGHDPTTMEDKEIHQIDCLIQKRRKELRQNKHVERVLTYMSKDLDMPIQYHDYIYVHNGKNVKLTCG